MLNGVLINCSRVFNAEGNISYAIPMGDYMLVHGLTRKTAICRADHKYDSIRASYCMGRGISFTSLKPLIHKIFEPKSTGVEGCSLLSIANPQSNMI